MGSRTTGWRESLLLLVALTGVNQAVFIGVRLAASLDAAAMGTSKATIGIMVATMGLVAASTSLAAGRWAERAGARRPMLVASAAMALACAIPLLWHDLAALFLLCALVGGGYNAYYIAQQAVIGQYGRPEDRVRNFATAGLGVTFAGLVSPLATGYAIDHGGHVIAFAMLAVFAGVIFALVATRVIVLPALPKAAAGTARDGSFDLLRQPELRAIFLYAAASLTIWQMILFLIPLYGIEVGLRAVEIGIVLGALAVTMSGARMSLGPLSRRYGAWAVLVASIGATALALVILPFAHSVVTLSLVSGLLGITLSTSVPLAQGLLYEHAPPERVTRALTLWSLAGSSLATIIPFLSGAVSAAFGMRPVFWGLALGMAAVFISGRRRLVGARRPGAVG